MARSRRGSRLHPATVLVLALAPWAAQEAFASAPPPESPGLETAMPAAPLHRAAPEGLVGRGGRARAPRALWVVRDALESRAETARAIADCARIGCSLIFLQVSGRWDAYFPSELFPPGLALASTEGDNLAYAIALAHARGIRVHAWINSLLAWSAPEPPPESAHVFRRHPDWFLVGPDGRSIVQMSRRELDRRRLDGYFLEPGVAAVRTELRRFMLDLVTRYDLDGVHLDYLRFPSLNWGFQPEVRESYRKATGIDPLDLYARERELTEARGAEWLARAREDWQGWHREGVTRLVRLVSRDLKVVRPELELSAAVLANPRSARDDFGQDWAAWLREGILDLAVPMAYRSSARGVLEQLEQIDRAVDAGARIYAGVSLQFLDADEIPPVEALMGRYGADGLAIFSFALLRRSPRAMRALAEGPG